MKLVTASAARELDQRVIGEAGVPGEELMLAAGEGLADACLLYTSDAADDVSTV